MASCPRVLRRESRNALEFGADAYISIPGRPALSSRPSAIRTILLTEISWLSKQRQSRASACTVDAKMTSWQNSTAGTATVFARISRSRASDFKWGGFLKFASAPVGHPLPFSALSAQRSASGGVLNRWSPPTDSNCDILQPINMYDTINRHRLEPRLSISQPWTKIPSSAQTR